MQEDMLYWLDLSERVLRRVEAGHRPEVLDLQSIYEMYASQGHSSARQVHADDLHRRRRPFVQPIFPDIHPELREVRNGAREREQLVP